MGSKSQTFVERWLRVRAKSALDWWYLSVTHSRPRKGLVLNERLVYILQTFNSLSGLNCFNGGRCCLMANWGGRWRKTKSRSRCYLTNRIRLFLFACLLPSSVGVSVFILLLNTAVFAHCLRSPDQNRIWSALEIEKNMFLLNDQSHVRSE